eukprot:CAMPEP_0194290050 /NCGR_PEP_ID=MMETSP0169-20130528/40448_1 /TAXON_ID=218684 /ORGANISM="Corethron pennatum, Strain L29A3" /LENGTH=1164 /DNA_ID=CAMNT_0039037529 /DNA_START=114 /DNA_END=3608 /DNA_ORIENTATION=-
MRCNLLISQVDAEIAKSDSAILERRDYQNLLHREQLTKNRNLNDFCDDDHDYNSIFGKKSNNCKWVAKYPEIRCELEWKGIYVKEKCPLTCGMCSLGCVNNPNYSDAIGFDCEYHRWSTSDCQMLGIVGYTRQDIDDLAKNCPESCGQCQSEASEKIENTANPTKRSSLNPTYAPTYKLTRTQTTDPTHTPVITRTRVPTSKPTKSPVKKPTVKPTPPSATTIPTKLPTDFPTNFPTKSCYDDILFIDAFGLTCNHHTISICAKMGVMGYSSFQVKKLVNSCPNSCGYCETGAPTNIPSSHPSLSPSLLPSSPPTLLPTRKPTNPPTPNCHDNSDFRDYRGLPCGRHVTSVCSRVGVLGYPKLHVKALMVNCPFSCGYCVTGSPSSVPSDTPTNFPSLLPSSVPTSVPSKTCHDMFNFIDHLGLGCKDHTQTECTKVGEIGYSVFQVKTLVASCPLSCGFCTTYSPSDIPSLSPTYSPTYYPTEMPTSAPTSTPTEVCHDNKHYRDHIGLTCSDHGKQISCDGALFEVGYTKRQVVTLRKNCLKSCGLCVSSSPSASPSVIPTYFPTYMPTWSPINTPTKLPTKRPTTIPGDSVTTKPTDGFVLSGTCEDNKTYKDHLGLDCSFYQTILCSEMKIMGFSLAQVNALKTNCPLSCGLCTFVAPSMSPLLTSKIKPLTNNAIDVENVENLESSESPEVFTVSTNFFGVQLKPLFQTLEDNSLKVFNRVTDKDMKEKLSAFTKKTFPDLKLKMSTTILDQIVVDTGNELFLDITMKKNIEMTSDSGKYISQAELEMFVENYLENSVIVPAVVETLQSNTDEFRVLKKISFAGFRGIGVARIQDEVVPWVGWMSNSMLITLSSTVGGLVMIFLFTAIYIFQRRRKITSSTSVGSSLSKSSSNSQKGRSRSRRGGSKRITNRSESEMSSGQSDDLFQSEANMESPLDDMQHAYGRKVDAQMRSDMSVMTKEQPLQQQEEISNKIASMIASPAAFIGYAGEHINSISFSPFSFGSGSFSNDKQMHRNRAHQRVEDANEKPTEDILDQHRELTTPSPILDQDRPNLADIEKSFNKRNRDSNRKSSKDRKTRSHSPNRGSKSKSKSRQKGIFSDDRPSIDTIERSFTPYNPIIPTRNNSTRTSGTAKSDRSSGRSSSSARSARSSRSTRGRR